MSSKGRQIAKSIGKSIKRKFEADFFQFPFWLEDQQRDLIYLPAPPFNTSPQSSPPLRTRKNIDPNMAVHAPKKSSSLGTIAVDESHSPGIIDHEEIIALTHDVKKFSDSLARLKLLFTEGVEPEEDARVVIHEGLGEVLSVLNPVMQQYPALQSPDIFTAARGLITMIKDHDYEAKMTQDEIRDFCDAIDQLALAFSSSVSEYLMGDMGPQLVMDIRTRSMNNIAGDETEGQTDDSETVQMTPDELDGILVSLDPGLSLALQRAKVWSKYVGDIITYIEKKAQLEQDYAKNLSRLANSVQSSLKKEGFLPLQSVYCTALSQDTEFASNLQATQAVLHSHKFVEPLSARRTEHDKVYKSVKEKWQREFRKMTDSVTNLRKAQALYMNRHQDLERAIELAAKADGEKIEKRRKAQEEALHKAAEAETTYKACVADANFRQQELFKVKAELLGQIREQIQLCDQIIKEVTIEYFQLYHTIISPLPLQYQTLSESSKSFVPGSQYAEYVRRLPGTNRPCQPEIFMFEPYVQGQKSSPDDTRKESVHSNGSVSDNHSPEGSPVTSPRRDKYRIPVKAWGQQLQSVPTSDTDSASCSSKSHESSPSGSPHRGTRRHLVSSQSLDELTEDEILAAAAAARNGKDKRAQLMKRTKTLSGVAGDESLDLRGLLLHGGRRNTTFGVDFQEQVDNFQTKVPPIVSKCLTEIERRGVMIKGIYRVSGVKSKVEHLCQRFDIDPEAVDLEDVHPNIISNVLKLYLRQLPEPLLTFRLYSDFIHTAKENMSGQLLNERLTDHLKKLILRLPSSNLRTCAVLLHHLQRVASHAETNQMSASNLGIVFGPTLLRPLEGSASLASLVDTPHQTRAIELLITHAHVIFGPSEDFQIAPSQTPIEQLGQALSSVLLPGQGRIQIQESCSSKAKTSSASIEPDDSSLPVFDSSSSSGTQPSSCDFVLPGTASQERNETQSIVINGLDLDGSKALSDEEEDGPDLLLPDQSKHQSDPLSVALSPRCIKVSGADSETSRNVRAKTSPLASSTGTSSQAKPVVTKSSSSPVVSRTSKTQLTTSKSVPGMGSGVDMATVLSSSTAGMAAALMMSSGSFASSEMSSSGTGQVSSASGEFSGTEGESVVPESPQTVQESTIEGVRQVEDGQSQSGSERSSSEDQIKKKLHSQQLQNIKYLTKAPSVDETSSNFFPKTTFTPAPTGSGATQSQATSDAAGPPPSPASTPEVQKAAVSEETKQGVETLKSVHEEPQAQEEQATQAPVTDSVQPLTTSSQPPQGGKGSMSRRSILEEMPIPTMKKPTSSAGSEGGTGGPDDGSIQAVIIPASPTIKRREMPSKIPTSPGTQRSAEAKQGFEKTDNRADRFRQEQRKLVKAIKSDAKIGAAVSTSESLTSERISTGSHAGATSPSFQKEAQRFSEVFDEVFSGGCALSMSSRPSSQSEESGMASDSIAKGEGSQSSKEESTLVQQQTKAVIHEGERQGTSETISQASGPAAGRQESVAPLRTMRPGTWAGKSESPQLGTQSSPRQKPASSSGDSSLSKPAMAFGRGRTLNMPSTSFMKKTTTTSGGTKTFTTTSVSKASAVTAQTTKTTPSSSTSSSSSATSSKTGLSGRVIGTKPTSTSLSPGIAMKRTPSSGSTDHSPQLCSRAAAATSKSVDDSSASSKSSSPVSRKSSGRGGELAPSRLAKSSSTSSPRAEVTAETSATEKSSSLSSQPSSPLHRHPSGETGSSSPSRSKAQRKPPSSSSSSAGATGSPRKIHERCQEKSSSSFSSPKARGQQGSPSKGRPSQLSTSPTGSPASSSPVTTPTSSAGKLSQDRTPRFV